MTLKIDHENSMANEDFSKTHALLAVDKELFV